MKKKPEIIVTNEPSVIKKREQMEQMLKRFTNALMGRKKNGDDK